MVNQLRLIDVSNNQGAINWDAALTDPDEPVDGVILKLTDGVTFFDEYAYPNYQQILDVARRRALDIVLGFYHFLQPAQASGAVQYAWYRHHLPSPLPAGTLTALDSEIEDVNPRQASQDWVSTHQGDLRFSPFFYTTQSMALAYFNNDPVLAACPLWLASLGFLPPSLGQWARTTLWQDRWTLRVNGITGPVDEDLIAQSKAQLRLLGVPAPQPVPPPATITMAHDQWLRAQPVATSARLVLVKAGAMLPVAGAGTPHWTQVQVGQQIGWVLNSNIA